MDLSSLEDIRPFYVMEILEKALRLQSLGRDIVHLEIGEPTENVDNLIINSAQNALNNNMKSITVHPEIIHRAKHSVATQSYYLCGRFLF